MRRNRVKCKYDEKIKEAWMIVIKYQRDDLIKRLRNYDKRNHHGKYALLCREAANFIERRCTVQENL